MKGGGGEMKADLHVHSYYSDGSSSIEEIMEQASAKGITHLSIVDHDTTIGIQHAQQVGKKYGIVVFPGIEISAFDYKRNRKVHILGYLFNQQAKHIQELCQPLLKRRHENSLWQLQHLQKHGFNLSLEELQEKAKHSTIIYKQHMMDCITDAPFYTAKYQQIYHALFKGNGICAHDIEYVDVFHAVEAIKADKGLAVLAHPGQFDSYDVIPDLVQKGLDGIERNHYSHTVKDLHKVEQYARKYQLLLTGGSDFHGRYGRPIEIGAFVSPVEFENPFTVYE